jgi:anti-sigma regulatory factor (Ser/Thr protein kinase)
VAIAADLGLDETERGRVALIATEAATNIAKHASTGELLVRAMVRGDAAGVELLALDRGPGMADVTRCLADGYSTAGSPGTGLGAMTRLASEFDIHSTVGAGTALLARVLREGRRGSATSPAFELGAVCLPVAGEAIAGDAWHYLQSEGRTVVLIADGLGHGPLAARAAQEAVKTLSEHGAAAPAALLQHVHTALRGTRGAAVAVAEIRSDERLLRFVGVGNISATILAGDGSRSLVSLNGIVGEQIRRVQVFEYPWPPGARLIMHTDGLTTRWDLRKYPGLAARDPSLIAGVLYRDHTRGRDDVTVVVVRESEVAA